MDSLKKTTKFTVLTAVLQIDVADRYIYQEQHLKGRFLVLIEKT